MTDTERLARIEEKVDAVGLRLDDFRVSVEGRISRLEVKAALWGTFGGIVVAVVLRFLGNR
jgi:hypothetical protein